MVTSIATTQTVVNKCIIPSYLYKELLLFAISKELFFNWKLDVSQGQSPVFLTMRVFYFGKIVKENIM